MLQMINITCCFCNISSWTFAWNDIARTNVKKAIVSIRVHVNYHTDKQAHMYACMYTDVHLTYTLTYMHKHDTCTHTYICNTYVHIYTIHTCMFSGHFSRAAIYTNKNYSYKWITQQTAINNCLHVQKAWILHNVHYDEISVIIKL